jgi:hypothetical protein
MLLVLQKEIVDIDFKDLKFQVLIDVLIDSNVKMTPDRSYVHSIDRQQCINNSSSIEPSY